MYSHPLGHIYKNTNNYILFGVQFQLCSVHYSTLTQVDVHYIITSVNISDIYQTRLGTFDPREEGLSREYVLRIPSVS